MTGYAPDALAALIAAHGPVVRVVVAEAHGSAPREPGAAMTVWAEGFDGTVGGGALEWEALAEARRMLPGGAPSIRRYPLGPALGQCCGGATTLIYERIETVAAPQTTADAPVHARPVSPDAPAAPPAAIRAHARAARAGEAAPLVFAQGWLSELTRPAEAPLFLYGAGHVGRALVRALDGLPFAVTWVDDAPARFPSGAGRAAALPCANPADAVALAPAGAIHLAMTYSHALDLEICHRVLARGDFARAGVIGSASKSRRFRARLRALGHADALIARLECPIGDRRLGKTPAAIAIGLAHDLMLGAAAADAAKAPAARETIA